MTFARAVEEALAELEAGRRAHESAMRHAFDEPRVIVYGETPAISEAWCRANGIAPHGKRAYIIKSASSCTRGLRVRDNDRVVFVGDVVQRADYVHVVLALVPCLLEVGGLAKVETREAVA